jgi:hypothetical protein
MKDVQLDTLLDRSIWISDDRISARLSLDCRGIDQIDFHGSQPVSRNAKLLHHPEGVLTFHFQQHGRPMQQIWSNVISCYPAGSILVQHIDECDVTLETLLYRHMLLVRCACSQTKPDCDPDGYQFHIFWNPKSLTTDVHGTRQWRLGSFESYPQLILKSNDQIELSSWLKRSGDYQGDFLIPEAWRRRIFKKQMISGAGTLADVKEEYLDKQVKIYDADTRIEIGGHGFTMSRTDDSRLSFSANLKQAVNGVYHSPLFSIRFHKDDTDSAKTAVQPAAQIFLDQKHLYDSMVAALPKLHIDGYPDLSDFFTMTPQIVESARVRDYGMTRACPGTYYWIWAWDNMVTALAQAHWGDISNLKRIVQFIRTYRDADGSIPARWTRQLQPMDSRGTGAMDFLFSELVLTLYRETGDRSVIQDNYDSIRNAFRAIARRCDANGMFRTMGMYPDLPQKMGRVSDSYVAMDEGAWYGLCRNVEKMAQLLIDDEIAGKSAALAKLIMGSFNQLFWDADAGFYCDSIHALKNVRVQSYPLYSLLGLESSVCQALFRDKAQICSNFILEHLLSESGVSLTPHWDANHTSEPAHSAWYPHWDYPAIRMLSERAVSSGLMRWLSTVNDCYQSLGYCPEFVAIIQDPEERWRHHGAAWNLNCATGWYRALIHGICGLHFSHESMICHATAGLPDFTLENLYFKGGRWSVRKSGTGTHLSGVEIDGDLIEGSYVVPSSYYTKQQHNLVMRYTDQDPGLPVLSDLVGASLLDVRSHENQMAYTINGQGTVDISLMCSGHVKAYLDGNEIDVGKHKTILLQTQLKGEHRLMLSLE